MSNKDGGGIGMMIALMAFLLAVGAMLLEICAAAWCQFLRLWRFGLLSEGKGFLRAMLLGGHLPQLLGCIRWGGLGRWGEARAASLGLLDERYRRFLEQRRQHEATLPGNWPNWWRFSCSMPFRILAAAFNSVCIGLGISSLSDIAGVQEDSPVREAVNVVAVGVAVPVFVLSYVSHQLPDELRPYTWEEFLGEERRSKLHCPYGAGGLCSPSRSSWERVTDPWLTEVTQTELRYERMLLTREAVVRHLFFGSDLERACEEEMRRQYVEWTAKVAQKREAELAARREREAHLAAYDKELTQRGRVERQKERQRILEGLDQARVCSERLLLSSDAERYGLTVDTATKIELAYWEAITLDDR